ncbi:hypothetical protein ACFUCQ_32245 [Streptomyces sp. NPDC057197]|uniref:hypothetical protein n=1 Tax=Streptomyces sp. NPDC057197 TaxID=3346045 RepID=UPI0036291831
MDTPELVSKVLDILAQGAGSAASAAGSSAAQALIAALRERLSGTEDGLAALDAFLGDPGDTAGATAARAVLERQVAADPGFGRLLADLTQAAEPSPQTITHSVVISDRARVTRSQISLGPLTVNNNAQGRLLLAVLAVALVALIALAGYGGARVFTDKDEGSGPVTGGHGASKPPAATSTASATTPTARPLPPTQATADAILPDRAALEGTEFESSPDAYFPDGERSDYQGTICGDYPELCAHRVHAGAAGGYAPNDLSEQSGWHAELQVLAHESEADAERTFAALADTTRNGTSTKIKPDPSAYTPPGNSRLGDEFASYRTLWEGQDLGIMCVIRRGPYIALITQEKDGGAAVLDNTTQTRLNTLMLRRMDEALSGTTPHTALREVQSTY